jgi:hypothetical protein
MAPYSERARRRQKILSVVETAMAERRTKVKLGSEDIDAWDVPIKQANEPWSEITLEDGAVLRFKSVISNVFRLEGRKDPEGNQMYAIKSSNALVIVSGPTNLSKKVN